MPLHRGVRFLGTVIMDGDYKRRVISWTAETVENFLPSVSVSKTEITKMLSQYSRVMMYVSTIMLLILATVWGLHTCEFLVIKKSCLLTCVSDTQKGSRNFSTVSAV